MRRVAPRFLTCPLALLTLTQSLESQTVLTVTVNTDTSAMSGGSNFGNPTGDLRTVLNYVNQHPGSPYNVVFNIPSGSLEISLGAMLPLLNLVNTDALTIDGANLGVAGNVTIDGSVASVPTYPGFWAQQGSITIQNMTIQNTLSKGGSGGVGAGGGLGAGGALFINQANVTLANVTMSGNAAIGGSGNAEGTDEGFGGGGGMFGGNGATALIGGGGGLGGHGVGGAGYGMVYTAGGGGGGIGPGGDGGSGSGSAGETGNPGGGFGISGRAGSGYPSAAGGTYAGGGGGGTYTGSKSASGGGGGVGGANGTYAYGGAGGFGGGGGGGGALVQIGGLAIRGGGGPGGFGGGGGGTFAVGRTSGTGGDGGFGGGGALGFGYRGTSGIGGFGGGGGTSALGGVGGGSGSGGAGGGAALGGAIFLNNATGYGEGGGTLRVTGPLTISNTTVTAGIGVTQNGAATGTAIFGTATIGYSITFSPGSSETISIGSGIADDSSTSLPGGSYTPGAGPGLGITIDAADSTGAVILSGTHTYAGPTHVTQGTLTLSSATLNGTGTVTVNAGAILQGVGAMSGTALISGTLRPGNSIGTLTFNNGLTLMSSATTEIEITPTTSSVIAVTGTAALAGTLELIPDAGSYIGGYYTILTATEGVTGTFNTPIVAPAGFSFVAVYPTGSPWNVLLVYEVIPTPTPTTLSLAAAAMSGNNKIVANYLNSIGTFLGAPYLTLANLTVAQQTSGVASISPSRLSFATYQSQNTAFTLSSATTSHLSLLRQGRGQKVAATLASLSQNEMGEEGHLLALNKIDDSSSEVSHPRGHPRSNCAEEAGKTNNIWLTLHGGIRDQEAGKPNNIWLTGFGEFTTQKEENGNPKFDTTSGGLLAAWDYGSIQKGLIGLGLAYVRSSIHEKWGFGHDLVQGGFATLYGSLYLSDFFLDLAVWGGLQRVNSTRNVFYRGFDEAAKVSYNIYQFNPHAELGYDWHVGKRETFEFFVAGDWANNFEEGCQERGAAPYNMKVGNRNSSMFQGEGGFRLFLLTEFESSLCIFKSKLSYLFKQPFKVGEITASIVGAPGSFTVDTFTSTQQFIAPGLEFYWKWNGGSYLSLLYDGQFGNGYILNEVSLRIGYNF